MRGPRHIPELLALGIRHAKRGPRAIDARELLLRSEAGSWRLHGAGAREGASNGLCGPDQRRLRGDYSNVREELLVLSRRDQEEPARTHFGHDCQP